MSEILEFYRNKGLDISSSDYSRLEDYASGMENSVLDGSIDDPVLLKRKGHQVKGDTHGGFGLIRFVRRNPDTDAEEEELLSVGKDLRRRKDASLTISYGGAASTVVGSLKYDPSRSAFYFQLTVDSVLVLDHSLGVGFDEASPITISDLATAINAVADFTASTAGTTTIPAAFLDITVEHNLLDSDLTVYAYEWEHIQYSDEVSSSTNGPFYQSLYCTQDQEEWEPASHTALNNVLYIAGGEEGALMKYDGIRIYRSGLPKLDVSAYEYSSGALAAGSYSYMIRAVHVDAVGNRIYGPLSDAVTVSNAGGKAIAVDDYFGGYFVGFNRASAVKNGAETAATLTVDSGHGLTKGDRIFITSGSSAIEEKVLSTTATTVTVSTARTVSDNAHFCPIGIEIFRTATGPGTTYYKVATVALDTTGAVTEYIDSTSDATLVGNEVLVEPEYEFGPAPACKYVAKYRGGLVVAGVALTSSNRLGSFQYSGVSPSDVWFADLENPEGFPSDGSYTVTVDSQLGDKIKGIREIGNSFIALKEKSIARITGEPTELNVDVDWLSKEVGCLSNASIQEIDKELVFLSTRGVEALTEMQAPDQRVGVKIRTIVENKGLSSTERLVFQKAVSSIYLPKQQYILFLPAEGGSDTETFSFTFPAQGEGSAPGSVSVSKAYANSNSRAYVLDFLRGAWYEWRAINMAGGIATFDDELWFSERRYSTFDSAVKYRAMKQLNNYDATDYEDHNQAIDWKHKTAWYAAGNRKIEKNWIRLEVSSIREIPNNSCTLTVKQEVNYRAGITKAQTTLALDPDETYGEVVAQTRLADGKFKTIRLVFENSEHQSTPEIEGWEIEVNRSYFPRLKS